MWDASGRLARWRLRLSEFDFYIVHRTGSKNQDVDAPSRLLTAETDGTKLKDRVPVLFISFETFQAEQKVKIEQEEEEPEDYSTSQGSVDQCFPENFAIADIKKSRKPTYRTCASLVRFKQPTRNAALWQ